MPSQTVDYLYKTASALAGLYVSLVSNVDGVTKYSATSPSDANGRWIINPKPPAGTYALYTGGAQGALTTLVDPDFVVDPFNDDGTAVFSKQVTIQAGGLTVAAGGINVTAGGISVTGTSTVTGNLTVSLSGQDVSASISGDAGQFRNLGFQTAGSPRWRVRANNTAEGGANVGSDFEINARDDTGASLGNAITINRATRVVTIVAGGVVTAGGFTVSAGGIAITGNSTLAGSLTLSGANNLLVAAGQGLDTSAAGQLTLAGTATSVKMKTTGPPIVGTSLTALGAGAQTLSAAALFGGVIEHTVTGAVADTFDTGTNLDAAFSSVATGDTVTCILTILGAFTVTLTAAAGITLRGTAAVVGTAAGKVVVLVLRRTGAAAWTVYAATGA